MLNILLFSIEDSVSSQKTNQLFFKDTPGRLNWSNSILPSTMKAIPGWTRKDGDWSVIPADANNIDNNGLHKRYLYTKETAVTELVG